MRARRSARSGSAQCGLAEQDRGPGLVLGDAGAVEQGDGVFDLGIGIPASAAVPRVRRFGRVLLDAATLLVERRERVLRFRFPARRRTGTTRRREHNPAGIAGRREEQAEIIGRRRMADFAAAANSRAASARSCKPARPVILKWQVRTWRRDRRAPPRTVPLGGLGIVGGNAEAIGIKFAEQRHGARIALFLDPLGRFCEGGQEITALKSPKARSGSPRGRKGCTRGRGGGCGRRTRARSSVGRRLHLWATFVGPGLLRRPRRRRRAAWLGGRRHDSTGASA